jgi:RHS repeat-associated protein
VSFRYDPSGRRIQKSGPNGTTNFLYDGANIIEELDASGNENARYAQNAKGIDEPFAELRSGVTGFYEADGLGSITSLSAPTATLSNTYTYDAFGNVVAATGSFVNPFQFTARDFDVETGLRYYRARYYDANIGRFLSEDAVGIPEAVNLYRYAENNPNRFVDPLGQQSAGTTTGISQAEVDAYIARLELALARAGWLARLAPLLEFAPALAVERRTPEQEARMLALANKLLGRSKPKVCKKTKEECKEILNNCIDECIDKLRGGEWPFRRCVADCMDKAGCDYTIPRPFYNPPPR